MQVYKNDQSFGPPFKFSALLWSNNTGDKYIYTPKLPCEERFPSRMAFSVYDLVRVTCQSRSQFFIYAISLGVQNKATTRQDISHANEIINANSHAREKPLLAGSRAEVNGSYGNNNNNDDCPRRDFARKAKSRGGTLVTRAYIKESTYS